MSKRGFNDLETIVPAKFAKVENESVEYVVSKKIWRINNKEMLRIVAHFNNTTLDRSVYDRETFDQIQEKCTYKFTYQKINRLFYIVKAELTDAVSTVDAQDGLSSEDFQLQKDVSVNVFVVCAYEMKDYSSNNQDGKNHNIKVVVVVRRDNDYVQCDMVINLAQATNFGITVHDDRATRVTKVLTRMYELQNQWCTAKVTCNKTDLNKMQYYKLLLKPHDELVEVDDMEQLDTVEMPNISYMNKVFSCVQVQDLTVGISDFVHKFTQKVNKMFKFTIETTDHRKIMATAFINNAKQEEYQEALQTVPMNVSAGEKVYAVLYRKYNDDQYCLASVLTYADSNEPDFYSLFC
ncbi:lef-3 [Spodoptera frugiperda granulovirus]|uniref:Lef-3 n=1 Tax=Spodoptera frugiperda granulovirus TaxID=307454 RepID=A0A0C5AUY0_9BBAC|nr:lef-3 [Spodoptera frugiperda granulovirus]AJK91773.1 lef-3 [Spodoptera frugiperda granulovirus]AXS01136.1 lef-3 [Spodoptera frugiperda granulovirus]